MLDTKQVQNPKRTNIVRRRGYNYHHHIALEREKTEDHLSVTMSKTAPNVETGSKRRIKGREINQITIQCL